MNSEPIDFKALIAQQYHVPRNLMVFVESSAFSNAGRMQEHESLKWLFERSAQRVVGLKTGVSLQFKMERSSDNKLTRYLKNTTETVRFDFSELYGRRIESLLQAHMKLYCDDPEVGGIDMLFVEPDASGTVPVAVWRSYVVIQSSGESEAYRDLNLPPHGEVLYEIPCRGVFHYNRPTDLAHAQRLLDDMGPSKAALVEAETDITTDPALERLAEVAESASRAMSEMPGTGNAAMPRQEIRIDVISHKDCLDGTAAAWVVKEYYEKQNRRDLTSAHFTVHVHFTDYHLPLPALTPKSNIFMVDFCPNDIEEIKELLRTCYSLTILDHHPKTRNIIDELRDWLQLEGIANRFDAYFSEAKSGALIAWDYLMPGPAPDVIAAVSDGDLWQFNLPNTKPIYEALKVYGSTLEGFAGCMDDRSAESVQELIDRGHVMLHAKDSMVDWTIRNTFCILEAQLLTDGEVKTVHLPAVNGSKPFADRACEELEKRYPGYPAYICYWDIDNASQRRYAIRACSGNLAQAVARYYGGNGHTTSAGFVLPASSVLQTVPEQMGTTSA